MVRGGPVDIDSFLRLPLVARVATNGPTLRPVWFLWEESALWWITDQNSVLARRVQAGDAEAVAVVDSCDLTTGQVVAVTIRGTLEIVALDVDRATRKFTKYLGSDVTTWDPGLRDSLALATTRLARLSVDRITAEDMSFSPSR